jgi:iron complex outermembrane receptor protein
MLFKKLSFSLLLLVVQLAFAEDKADLVLPSTDVNGNLIGISSDPMVDPSNVMNGRELSIKRESSIGETLTNIPGVSNSSYGPSVGRPIVRGMDGDHIQILQNGLGNLDVSNLSADHGVSIDPLIIEQIELIRGPSALLYGNGVSGGVINAVDHRIPKEALDGITGRAESRYESVNRGKSNAAVIDLGTSSFVIHADAYNRNTENLSIPDYAVSKYLGINDASHGKGTLLNSSSNTYGGAMGASMIFDNGYAGLSFSNHNSNYGSPKEDTVRLDMESNRWDFSSELKELPSFFNRIKVRMSNTDYQHSEIDSGVIQTTFKNTGTEGSFELGHKEIYGLNGLVGFAFDNSQFKSIGNESFAPNSQTISQSVYMLETYKFYQHKISFALRRAEHQIDSIQNKDFSTNNASIGDEYILNDVWSVKTNINHLERAPSYYELFANGVHAATGQYIVGNASINNEISNGIDFNIKRKDSGNTTSLSAYYNYFNSYIGLFNTGSNVDKNGISPGTWDEAIFKSVKASFKGIELESKQLVTDNLTANIRTEYVIAKNEDTGTYLPRIAPLKIGIGSTYQKERYSLNINLLHAFAQNKLSANELKTDAYTNLSLLATYQLPIKYNVELFTKANNLLNEEIRDATSYIKDIAPQGGRSIMFGLRGDF